MTDRPLRVLIVAETALPYLSGVTVATDALARGLGAAGHEVLVFAPEPPAGSVAAAPTASGPAPQVAWLPSMQLPPPAPRGYRVPVPARGGAATRSALAFAPDVVHVQSPFGAGLRGRRIARALGVPLAFTHHTRFEDYGHYLGALRSPGAGILARWLRAFWLACDAVVAPGADLGAEIRAALGTHGRPLVATIPTGIDVAAIRRLEAPDLRSLAGWPPDAVVAVALGRLAPEKGLAELLTAVARSSEVRLAVIGGGPSMGELRSRATRPDLRGRVWFAGPRPRPAALALASGGDLFVIASQTETQGLVVAEALAAGLPVVGVDAPGVRDAVRPGVDGTLVAADPAADRVARLGAAIEELARDGSRRAAMAAAARRDAGRFDLAPRVAEMVELYRTVLETRR